MMKLEAGYDDDEFPVWWFSPARDEGQITQKGQVTEVKTQEDEVDEGDEVLEEVPPRLPAPREGRLTRPTLSPDLTSPDLIIPDKAESSGFSDHELTLLTDQGITEITPGRWMRTEEQSGGARASL